MASPAAAAAVAAVAALCVSAVAAAASPASGPHMADLSVLLPPRMTKPVEYRLIGGDGCFSWSWDHHDIISVKPEYNESSRCSTSARLASIAPYSGRKETSVYATDIISGITIHCKVFVDKIYRIRIFHHAVKIDLDEIATLRVHAFDDEENVFSSLVGLQFLWQLTPRLLDNSGHHLVHIPLKETPWSDCGGFCGDMNIRFELEDRNLGSDFFVVKGIEIGQEVVSAQLFEPQFEHVIDTIMLTVAEAISLEPPSPVLVTVGVLVKFKLKVFRQKVAQVVNLPSQYHHWHVTNSSVAQVDSSLGILHALSLGFTDVVVEDTRVSGHEQVSSLHVVIPRTLFLYLVPIVDDSAHLHGITNIPSSEVWYVFPGQKYMVVAKAFAEGFDARQIFVTEENELKLESSTVEFWNLLLVPDNSLGSYEVQTSRLLSPVSQGKGYLAASLTYQTEASGPAKVLKLVQEVNVCSKVKATWEGMENSNIIHLPWVPGVFQEIELKAVGGCGKTLEDYKLFSSDENVAFVSDYRIARAKKPGQAVIRVVSTFDSLNFDEVTIEVSTPSVLAILPIFPVEVAVGTQLHAAVTLKTSNGHSFSRCDYFNAFIRWSLLSENESFEVVDTAEASSIEALKHYAGSWAKYGYPCAWITLNASTAGQATIVATFSFESDSYFETFSGPIFLKDTSKISAYYPLVVLQAGNGNQFGGYWVDLSRIQSGIQNMDNNSPKELYLVPGSTMDVFLFGGPEKWDQVVDFVETVDVIGELKNYIVNSAVQKISSRLFRISCQSKGNFKLLFSRGNMIGKDHPVPAVAKSEFTVVCDFPSAITLIANENENRLNILEAASKADRNPYRLQASPVVISNGRSIRLAAAGVHGNGRFFANSSSLCLKWEVTECEGLAYFDQAKDAEMLDQSSWERFLVLQNSTGLVAQVRVAASESSIQMAYLSVNDKVELDIKYADELGYIFTEALGIAPLKIETNYPDVVSILMPKDGNGTHGAHERFVLQARSHGTALIRLHIGHIPKKADFIMVSVGAQMYPRDVVIHSGQHLNFTIIGDRMDVRGSGQWLSSNEKVMHVNRITGEAQAHDEGIAEVIFKGPNLKLQTTVTVLKVNQLVVDAPAEMLTNAAGPPDGYKFSVRLSDSAGHSTECFVNQINVPFDCKVEPSFVGFVEPWIDLAAKKSYCLFHPYSPAQLLPVKLNPKEGFLHIVVHANLKEDPKVTGSAHALFVKGFYIKEPGKLSLTPSSNYSIITIGGNTDVELLWSAKDSMSVSRVYTNDNKGVPGQVVYRVEALKRQPFSDKVTIILPATGQTEEVEVSYDTGERTETASSSALTTLAVILTCIVVPVVTAALFMKLLEKPTGQAPSRRTAPTPAAAASPAAMPDPASPDNGQFSPRTPQPFMEYVRRTIDDTPYYKRDGRRRFNPQNTY